MIRSIRLERGDSGDDGVMVEVEARKRFGKSHSGMADERVEQAEAVAESKRGEVAKGSLAIVRRRPVQSESLELLFQALLLGQISTALNQLHSHEAWKSDGDISQA